MSFLPFCSLEGEMQMLHGGEIGGFAQLVSQFVTLDSSLGCSVQGKGGGSAQAGSAGSPRLGAESQAETYGNHQQVGIHSKNPLSTTCYFFLLHSVHPRQFALKKGSPIPPKNPETELYISEFYLRWLCTYLHCKFSGYPPSPDSFTVSSPF